MKIKQLLIVMALCLVTTFCKGQDLADDKYTFCKNYFAAKTFAEFGLQYRSDPDKMEPYFQDANTLAKSAKNILSRIAPKLKTKLTVANIAQLNKVLDFIIDKTGSLYFDDSDVMKLSLLFKIWEQIELHDNIFPKLFKP